MAADNLMGVASHTRTTNTCSTGLMRRAVGQDAELALKKTWRRERYGVLVLDPEGERPVTKPTPRPPTAPARTPSRTKAMTVSRMEPPRSCSQNAIGLVSAHSAGGVRLNTALSPELRAGLLLDPVKCTKSSAFLAGKASVPSPSDSRRVSGTEMWEKLPNQFRIAFCSCKLEAIR